MIEETIKEFLRERIDCLPVLVIGDVMLDRYFLDVK